MHATASIAEKSLNTIIEQGCYNVIVDFKELEYMSSAGFGVLVAILDVLMLKDRNMIILNLFSKT